MVKRPENRAAVHGKMFEINGVEASQGSITDLQLQIPEKPGNLKVESRTETSKYLQGGRQVLKIQMNKKNQIKARQSC